jgi:replicative DNA helicase
MIDKLIPKASDIEQVVLGAMLIESDAFLAVSDIITPGSFLDEKRRTVYQAILKLGNNNQKIDMVTVTNELKITGELNESLSPYYISQLTNRTASATNIIEHATILKQYQIRRDIIEISNNMLDSAYDDTVDPVNLVDYFITEAYKVGDIKEGDTEVSNVDTLRELTAKIEFAKANKGITGVECGYERIDKILGGYQPSDFIIKAARPGMGKTAEALCEAHFIANVNHKNAMFVSLEMSKLQLMQRLVSAYSEIPLETLRNGNLTDQEWKIYHQTLGRLESDNLKIYDKTFSLFGIVKTAKKLALKGELDILYIDYIQLIDHVVSGANREQTVSFISRTLKLLAKELNIPVVALSQLSRAVEIRGGDHRPMLSDLRESGSLEQDADVVQFIWRPEYYDIMEDESGNSYVGAAYVITAKNRHGALKDTKLRFVGHCVRFDNWTETEMSLSPEPFTPMPINTDFDTIPIESKDNKDDDDDTPF